ncbi:MAG: hypothetical protein OEV40_05990 [Acidimicrobiia bacterium]|nr:hypothetical protein [Acidimicrobiia bacterium]
MHADLQHLLAKDLLPDVTAVPLDDLRVLRTDCSAAEGDVSFVRRVAQGRLDIVGHETRRRSGASDAEPDVSGLLFDLPDILTDSGPPADTTTSAPGGRLVAIHEPGTIAQTLVGQLDAAASPTELASLDGLDGDRLASLMDTLRAFEVELSTTRRRLHERIDAIQNEIARRYRDGEASIDSLLN